MSLPSTVVQAVVTTDGSCFPNDGTGNGGWAAVIRIQGLAAQETSGGLRKSTTAPVTNNVAELTAVLEGLRALPDTIRTVLIRTDSQYTMNSLTIWHSGWKARGWRTSQGEPVKNRPLIETILAEIAKRDSVSFEWTKGHSTDIDNCRCDELALNERHKLDNLSTS